MQLEKQVCSIAESFKLTSRGISATGSYIRWFQDGSKTYPSDMFHITNVEEDNNIEELGPAYSPSELLNMLPCVGINYMSNKEHLSSFDVFYTYKKSDGSAKLYSFRKITLASALATLLIALLDDNLLNATECNKNLLGS